MSRSLSSCDRNVSRMRLPQRFGNTSGLPSARDRAASRTSSARGLSGTRCSRFIFMRSAAMVHTRPVVSISSHVASRTSPDRAAVKTRNSNASLTARVALDALACCSSGIGFGSHVLRLSSSGAVAPVNRRGTGAWTAAGRVLETTWCALRTALAECSTVFL